jgi:hypothetical protein
LKVREEIELKAQRKAGECLAQLEKGKEGKNKMQVESTKDPGIDPYFGLCPVCGGATGYMYERPVDLRENVSYGGHWTTCAAHKKKWGQERMWTAYLKMTDVELERQYALLETYEEVEGVYPARSRLARDRGFWITWCGCLQAAWRALRKKGNQS